MFDAEMVTWISVTTTRDVYGNATETVAPGRSLPAMVAGRTNSENTGQDAPSAVIGKTLYILDATVTIGPSDRFIVRGESYEVLGEGHRWGSSGIEVWVKRTEVRP